MIGVPNSLNLNCKVHVMKEAPGPSVSEEIADIFTNYNIDVTDETDNQFKLQMIYTTGFDGDTRLIQFINERETR